MLNYNKNLKQVSQKLRGSMTDAELLLWSKLKGKQVKGLQFYRQKIIGNYIVDFYCAKAGLVIEVDGGQHYTVAGRSAMLIVTGNCSLVDFEFLDIPITMC